MPKAQALTGSRSGLPLGATKETHHLGFCNCELKKELSVRFWPDDGE